MVNEARKATFAFLKGKASAEEVVALLSKTPSKPAKPEALDVEQAVLEVSEDFVTPQETSGYTWGDVEVYWHAMTPAQHAELEAARKKAGV